jgi:hypothetical protein
MRHSILWFCFSLLGLAALAQDSVTIASDPRDMSRPISTLVNQLRRGERISITYEDPRYENPADIEDVTAAVAKSSEEEKTVGPRILVPRGHPITFVYAAGDIRSRAGAESTLARMTREYDSVGGPTFVVVRDGVRLHILPSDILAASGSRVREGSIFETIVNVPQAQRDAGQLLRAICDQIQKQTGYGVKIGPSVPGNILSRYRSDTGVSNKSARVAIEDLLDRVSLAGSFDWDLYYDPADKAYMLNFSYVGPAAQP